MYKYISKLKNKKGMSTIEVVIGMMIFILIFGFMLDLIMITWKFNVIAQTNTQMARIAGIQGGISNTVPPAWPGGSANYVKRSGPGDRTLEKILENSLGAAGITDYSYDVPSREDYGDPFKTSITVTYKWEYMSKMLPGEYKQTITSTRPAMSEWKYDYNDWDGE